MSGTIKMNEEEFIEPMRYAIEGKEATLYPAKGLDRPLVILNSYSGDGSSVIAGIREIREDVDINLLNIGNLEWFHDMTPWPSPPTSKHDVPGTGGADAYITLLTTKIIPEAKRRVNGTPVHTCIAGYSLAGLFALYVAYQCDEFDLVASMSGSFWYPGFRDHVLSHSMRKNPERVYISLGDAEARTRNPVLKTVQENTEAIVTHLEGHGMDITYELNPGNHFRDADARIAKGILAVL